MLHPFDGTLNSIFSKQCKGYINLHLGNEQKKKFKVVSNDGCEMNIRIFFNIG